MTSAAQGLEEKQGLAARRLGFMTLFRADRWAGTHERRAVASVPTEAFFLLYGKIPGNPPLERLCALNNGQKIKGLAANSRVAEQRSHSARQGSKIPRSRTYQGNPRRRTQCTKAEARSRPL
jgi:hypothetical protein